MRVGILTFQWAVNYGAMLQMYALKTYLENRGVSAEIIDFSPKELSKRYNLNPFSEGLSLKGRVKRAIEYVVKKNQHNKFKNFKNDNFCFSEEIIESTKLKKKLAEYDLVIVGSDQVWNSSITKDYISDYLLYNFKCKKVSYAASFGSSNIPDDVMGMVSEALKDFSSVSIREKESIVTLNQITTKDLELVLDPVFLLSKEDWKQLKTENKVKGGYVLVYMLEKNLELLEAAKKISQDKNIPIVSIETPFLRFLDGSKEIRKLHHVGPSEFVTIFDDASYILTNSFHGTSFSLLLEKPFLSFSHSKGNMRIKNLLEYYGLEHLQIYNQEKDINEINRILDECYKVYEFTNLNIVDQIEHSKQFLNRSVKLK